MTHAAKYAEWRTRHIEKNAALQKAVAFRLGMYSGIKSELGQQTVDGWCASMLGALLGWGEELEPKSPSPQSVVPQEVVKAFDLDVPLSGRDRAAGDRDE